MYNKGGLDSLVKLPALHSLTLFTKHPSDFDTEIEMCEAVWPPVVPSQLRAFIKQVTSINDAGRTPSLEVVLPGSIFDKFTGPVSPWSEGENEEELE